MFTVDVKQQHNNNLSLVMSEYTHNDRKLFYLHIYHTQISFTLQSMQIKYLLVSRDEYLEGKTCKQRRKNLTCLSFRNVLWVDILVVETIDINIVPRTAQG